MKKILKKQHLNLFNHKFIEYLTNLSMTLKFDNKELPFMHILLKHQYLHLKPINKTLLLLCILLNNYCLPNKMLNSNKRIRHNE